jgi:hypothetical protein
MPEEDRIAWTATVMDLGARMVLFPPLTRPVFEDIASGFMAAAVRRLGTISPPKKPTEEIIDLAEGGAF